MNLATMNREAFIVEHAARADRAAFRRILAPRGGKKLRAGGELG